MTDDERDDLEAVTQEIAQAVSVLLARGWHVSPHGTLLGTARALVQLALLHLQSHPEQRESVLTTLRAVANCVEVETAVRH